MPKDLVMPRMGATMTEGTVVRWLKQPGEKVNLDEPVVEIETDKSTVELAAPAAGVLGPWLVAVGTTVPIGQPLVVILDPGGQTAAASAEPEGERRASPNARRVAREHGLDLATVVGAGPGGRIVEDDVLKAVAARGQAPVGGGGAVAAPQAAEPKASPVAKKVAREHGIDLRLVRGTGPGGRIVEEDVLREVAARASAGGPSPGPSPAAAAPPTREPLTGVRRVAAERMTHSFTTTPHFYLHVEVEATALVEWQRRRSARATPDAGPAPTYTDFLILFSAVALREQPRVNASWQAGQLQFNTSVNIGLAVATERGLMVPVLREVAHLTLTEITRRRAEIVTKAKMGKLMPDDFIEGTFTITNLGMYGIDSFNAILNPPQSAILAVGGIKERPWVVGGQLMARPTVHLSLSADHRVLDGAEAARFLSRIAELIEAPQELVA